MDNHIVSLPNNGSEPFNIGRLIISIAQAFSHDTKKASYDALWLAQTVEIRLSSDYTVITPDDIAAVTHQILKSFDELAAVQYAARHRLIASIRRRGRPSFSPPERSPRIDESPFR